MRLFQVRNSFFLTLFKTFYRIFVFSQIPIWIWEENSYLVYYVEYLKHMASKDIDLLVIAMLIVENITQILLDASDHSRFLYCI